MAASGRTGNLAERDGSCLCAFLPPVLPPNVWETLDLCLLWDSANGRQDTRGKNYKGKGKREKTLGSSSFLSELYEALPSGVTWAL